MGGREQAWGVQKERVRGERGRAQILSRELLRFPRQEVTDQIQIRTAGRVLGACGKWIGPEKRSSTRGRER